MAENTERKVLIDVSIKAKETLKEYAELKIKELNKTFSSYYYYFLDYISITILKPNMEIQ